MRIGTMAAVLVCLAAWPALAAAPIADLKGATTAALAAQKTFDKTRVAACGAEIGIVGDQVKLGLATPSVGLDSVHNAAGTCLADVLDAAIDARIAVMASAQTILAAGGVQGTLGFLVGDGSVLDQFQGKLNVELEKSRKQIEKRLRSYAAGIAKLTAGAFRHTIVVPPLRMDVAPAPNVPALNTSYENLLHPSRVVLAVAGGSTLVGNDGTVCVAGRAYVNFGIPSINVALFGDTSPSPKLNVSFTPLAGRWRTCFTNVPDGNYRIAADQDPNHDAIFGEVATEFITIGVP